MSDCHSHNEYIYNWKVILLNKAAMEGYKTTINNTAPTEPSAGFSSVSVVTLDNRSVGY